MGIISWIIVGAISGWLASGLAGSKEKKGCIFNIVLGIIGALLGGFIMNEFGKQGVTGFDLWSIFVATLGAIIILTIAKILR